MSSPRFRSILAVVTDPFAAEQLAADKAAALARRLGARLTVFNSFMIPQPVNDVPMGSHKLIIESAIRHRKERLEQTAARWRKQGVKVKVVVEWDYPAHEAIIRALRRQSADLVVTHSHRHGRIARWVLANTDWELIRHCPCPVWFVRSKALSRAPRLLVAVDPFHAHEKPARLDDRLLATAVGLTQHVGGTVDAAHAYHAPIGSAPGTIVEPFRVPSAAHVARERAALVARTMARLAARFDIDEKRSHVVEGEPALSIARLVSRRDIDVLVMGAVSRSASARAVIGNTAEKVIDAVDCDVLVVKPAGFRSSVTGTRPR